MYLKKAAVLNSGAIKKAVIEPEFFEDGRPKPLLLVGGNGTGKTNIISFISDALTEMAASAYIDIVDQTGNGHKYFRLVASSSIRVGEAFELAVLEFDREGSAEFYHSRAGNVSELDVQEILSEFSYAGYVGDGNSKHQSMSDISSKKTFSSEVFAYFPSHRNEPNHWLQDHENFDNIYTSFQKQFSNQLGRPIFVQTSFERTKQWLVDVLIDMGLQPLEVLAQPSLEGVAALASRAMANVPTWRALNEIVSAVLQVPGSHIARTNRHHGYRKVCIARNGEVYLPTIDNMSSGQASIFSMFATIVRYADKIQNPLNISEISGIVLIDEVDAHLHSEMQYEIIPYLVAMFPRIQFIISSHAPLYIMGMDKKFGGDGYTIFELPSCTKIGAERFSEFEKSYNYFKDTKKYEEEVNRRFLESARHVVVCEGETDPNYISKAAQLLGYKWLCENVEFSWVGQNIGGQAHGGGESGLNALVKSLKANASLHGMKVVALYDGDTKVANLDNDKLFVRRMPYFSERKVKSGIENLVPAHLITDDFYRERMTPGNDGGEIVVRYLAKHDLCNHICGPDAQVSWFEDFRPILDELSRLLEPSGTV